MEAILAVKMPVVVALDNKAPKPPRPPKEGRKVDELSREGMAKWCKIDNTHWHDLEECREV